MSLLRNRSVLALALAAFIATIAVPAHAAEYKMLGCSGAARDPFYTITNNTTSPQNPAGIFNFWNNCGGQGGDPPGNAAYLRIEENQAAGNAGPGAFLAFNFDTPNQFIHFRAAGGYTRQPGAFNKGWRSRLLISGGSAGAQELVSQGAGLCNCGDQWATTSTFASHLWPRAGYLDFTRFTLEMVCLEIEPGCDRTGVNETDLNGMVFILSDEYTSAVNLTNTGSPFFSGQWVRGAQSISYNWTELGSGMKMERVYVDGAVRNEINHNCNVGTSQANGEYALVYQPCDAAADIGRSFPFETASVADGAHSVVVCTQDYAQWGNLNGSGGQSCDSRTVRTDNTAPGAPSGLYVTSANPQRYLSHFGANFSLPPNQGSPISKVHYQVTDTAGNAVGPEQVLSATDPTALPDVAGPTAAGDYRLKVWLEDQVGFQGPATSTPIPHDTTPPGAPQNIAVTPPGTSRAADGFDVRWNDITDGGSPIDAVHYQVLSGSGDVVVPTKDVSGSEIQAIQDLAAPSNSGNFSLRMWLSDAEGNAGAPATVPLAYSCVRSGVGGGNKVTTGLGPQAGDDQIVHQGEGSTLVGTLSGPGGNIANAPICVYGRISTDPDRSFEGIAMSDAGGGYRFPVPAGPSRHFTAIYRGDHREVSSTSQIETIVNPTFYAKKKVVRNKHFARFYGEIPGPHNDQVVVVLQVKSGKGWLAFRRYRTRDGGKYVLGYRFNRTTRPTKYLMRAQVRATTGYPYLQGNSRRLPLKVVPSR
jgi:hypothetical protein